MNKPYSRLFKVLSLFIVVALACQCGGVTPDPTPTPQPTPLPPAAPVVADRFPNSGDELATDGTIQVYFDQAMDKASVEAALSIEPAVVGTYAWLDDATVEFTPSTPFERATRYSVTVAPTAKSAAGIAMGEAYTFNADSIGYLEVTQVLPAPDSQGVEAQAAITVMFNRPVVPLGLSTDTTVDLPNPLSFDPPVQGSGEWLNTSIYVFRPDTALAGGITYNATVKSGLTSTAGSLLEKDFTWSFSTLPPSVLSVEPAFATPDVRLDAPVRVTFNQPMDHASTEAAFSLRTAGDPPGAPVAGSFEWADDDLSFLFTANDLLTLGTSYNVNVTTNAKSIDGETAITEAWQTSFTTVYAPAVVSTEPSEGSGLPPYNSLRIVFASPMDPKTLKDNVSISPEAEMTYEFFSDYDKSYYLSFSFKPATEYTLTLGPEMADPYGNKLGTSTVLHFRTLDYDPLFQLNTRGDIGVYSAYNPTTLYVTYRNLSRMQFNLYRMTMDDFARWTGPSAYDFQQSYVPADPLRDWTLNVENFQNENAYAELPLTEDGSALAPGIYFLRGRAIDLPDYYRVNHVIVVTKYNITLKTTFDKTLAWVTDQQSGDVVPGLPLTIRGADFNVIASGSTDADGLYQADLATELPDLYTTTYAVTGEGDDFAMTVSSWTNGIEAYEFNLSTNYYPPAGSVYLYTDRPVYRPGQEVSFRGIVRSENDARFSIPDTAPLLVTVNNDQGDEVYRQSLALNEFGAFHDVLKLPEGASIGYYSINVQTEGGPYQSSLGFLVAEYRAPEFLVNVTTDKPEVVAGETIRATIETNFYFGGAVSNADVQWTLLSANSFFQYNGTGYYDFSDFDYTSGEGTAFYGTFGEVIASGEAKTDAQGKVVLNIPADIGKRINSQIFTLEATVTDVSDQAVSGRTQITVHQGDYYVGVGPQEFVGSAGQEMPFNIITLAWNGDPSPNRQVNVTYYEHDWMCAQEEDEFGNTIWQCTAKDTEVATDTVTTDADGKATSSFAPPSGGTYKVLVTSRDSGGREIRAASYVWVSSSEFVAWRQDNNNRIELVTDRREYKPGDTATILIPSPFQGEAKALLTIERGDIYHTEVLTLTSNSTVYELPITADYAPDVYVSVVLVKSVDENNPAPAFRMGLAHLKVSTEQQVINVTLTPDKSKVGPRDTVTYEVKATDFAGKPVQAEFSLGLADLAALSLAAPNSGPILTAFYGERGLSVRTAVGLTLSVDQLNVETAAVKGGGGGAEEGFAEVRGDFRDTAYWNATVVTDANGEATVSITLPDNLTTWRLDARGISKNSLVGQSTVDIVATKDLLIRPVTPRFFVVGDVAQLAAVVNNNTADDLEVEVSLAGSGFTLDAATPSSQTVTVPANNRTRVEWTATIADVIGVDMTFGASGGGLSDASKPPLGTPPDQIVPVYRYSSPETVGTAGELDGQDSIMELIALPKRFDVTQGTLDVIVNPSLAAGMTSGLEYLEYNPSDGTEQTLSRFLPNVLTYRSLKELGINDPALETRLTALVNSGTQRLYSGQHADGGWGWWVTDQSDPFITAYVLFGLSHSAEAGFTVETKVMDRAAAYLQAYVDATSDSGTEAWRLNRRAFVLYALASYGKGDVSATTALYDDRENMDTYARAYLALTLAIFDANDTRIQTILSDINNAAIVSATGAHWEEAGRDTRNMNTDTRSTAIVLSALATLDPDNNLNPNVVRWLMVARKANGYWESSQETAWALIGLTDWMTATGELTANYTYHVALNGNTLVDGNATVENLRERVDLHVQVADLIKDQANRVVFERSAGDGRMYYTAHLTVYQDVKDVDALNKGLVVARQYSIPDGVCGTKDNEPCPLVTSAQVGDTIQVKVTIIAPNDMYYVVVEDPIPAGMEPVDTSLLTTSVVGEAPQLNYQNPLYYGWGWWWFSNTDLRDEKVVLSATYLPKGTYEYTYTLHASLAGTYNVIPTTGKETYFPEVSGRGDGMVFTITP